MNFGYKNTWSTCWGDGLNGLGDVATPKLFPIHLRFTFIERDLPSILDIERGSFEFPLEEGDLREIFYREKMVALTAEHKEVVVGYAIFILHNHFYELFTLGVKNGYRRAGVASQLVQSRIQMLCRGARSKIKARVRETNLTAQLFLRSQGFRATKILKGYYTNIDEDCYQMQYTLPSRSNWLSGSRYQVRG